MGVAVKGSQTPRFLIAPEPAGCSVDHAEAAIKLAAGYGLVLDEWQQTVVRAWMRTTARGRWCSGTWAVSVARQNGKNGALEAVELYCMVALGLKILHTSHLLPSARKAFRRLMQFFGLKKDDPSARFPELNALVVDIRKTNGQEAIELSNGGLIELGARTGAAGRGSSFDVLVIDEAQEYEPDEQEALKPTISAASKGDPVTVFMGTPPADLSVRGEPFIRVRNNAVLGKARRTAWVEFSAAGDVDLMDEATLTAFVHDRKNWAASNPAMGIRINEQTIEDELNEMSARSFARERLNMFPTPVDNARRAFKMEAWDALAVDDPDPDWKIAAYGVDMNLERTKVSVAFGAFAEDPVVHLEMAADAPFSEAGTSALVEWFWERCHRRAPVIIDGFSPARDILEVPLRKRGIQVYILGAAESVQAFAMLDHAVHRERSVSHFGQEHLDSSIRHTVKEPIKGRPGNYRANRDTLDADLAPTVSVICAHYGARKFAKRRSSERKPRAAIFA